MIESESENFFIMSDFIHKHDAIDAEIKKEKDKRNQIKKVFLIMDVMLLTLLFCVECYLHYAELHDGDPWFNYFLISMIPPVLTCLFNLVLVVSAFYLTR